MDVVLYMRYSSANQTEQSIEGQDRVCTEFCKKQGYEIVGKYIDRALSASKDTDKRTQFQRMIKDSEKGRWQGVVVYKLDRFARNRYDSATYKARLKKNGVRVISATENITDSPEGIILESVLEGMAEFYSKELAQKVTRGMRESALKGNVCGGSVPLGYKIEGKKYVVDEPAAEIVREAFRLYSEGHTIKEICEIFNNKGYRTSKGAEFNKNSFRAIFLNERYTGVYIHGEIRVEGGIPAIIDKQTFEAVRKKMTANKNAPARSKGTVDYLLTQKLFCGHCGSLMVGECGRSVNGNTYYYYSCTSRKREGTCKKKPLRKEWIERVVAEDAVSSLTPETINELAEIAVKASEDEVAHNTTIPALRAELHDVEKSIANLLRLVERGSDSESLFARLEQLEDTKRAVTVRLREAEDDVVILEKDQVVWWLSKFTKGDINNETFRRQIIDLLVNSVTVWDEPDGSYRIEYVVNLVFNRNRTIKSSDLACSGARQEDNPNYHKFGFLLFPAYTVATLRRTHPAP